MDWKTMLAYVTPSALRQRLLCGGRHATCPPASWADLAAARGLKSAAAVLLAAAVYRRCGLWQVRAGCWLATARLGGEVYHDGERLKAKLLAKQLALAAGLPPAGWLCCPQRLLSGELVRGRPPASWAGLAAARG